MLIAYFRNIFQVRIYYGRFLFWAVFLISISLNIFRATTMYTAVWDEHTHLSYVQYLYEGIIPAEGYPLSSWAKEAFSCRPHALFGMMTSVPCGQIGPAYLYPTGGTSTSQGWPPIYYFLVSVMVRPLLLMTSDPMFASRLATSVIWSVGSALFAVATFRISKNIVGAYSVGLLLNAIPYFAYFSAFVSPHSMIPLFAALGLFIVMGNSAIFDQEQNVERSQNVFWRIRYLILFAIYSLVVAFSVPQGLALVVLFAFVLVLSPYRNQNQFARTKLFHILRNKVPEIITSVVSLLLFVLIFRFWAWQVIARKVIPPWEIDQSLANIDTPNPEYLSFLDQVSSRWWSFWPDAYNEGYPVSPLISFVEDTWSFIIPAAALAVLLYWSKPVLFRLVVLSIFISAPLISIAYDLVFQAGVPSRYGLSFSVVGLLGLANTKINKKISLIIVCLAAVTYLAAWFINPLYVEATSCYLPADSQQVLCP